jgi:hypothetical protein
VHVEIVSFDVWLSLDLMASEFSSLTRNVFSRSQKAFGKDLRKYWQGDSQKAFSHRFHYIFISQTRQELPSVASAFSVVHLIPSKFLEKMDSREGCRLGKAMNVSEEISNESHHGEFPQMLVNSRMWVDCGEDPTVWFCRPIFVVSWIYISNTIDHRT